MFVTWGHFDSELFGSVPEVHARCLACVFFFFMTVAKALAKYSTVCFSALTCFHVASEDGSMVKPKSLRLRKPTGSHVTSPMVLAVISKISPPGLRFIPLYRHMSE